MTKTQLKLGNIRQIFPIFKFARVAKNITRIINKIASSRPENMIRFVLGHYLFTKAHSFPRASLWENCSLLETDNVRGQKSVHISATNGDYCSFDQRLYRAYVTSTVPKCPLLVHNTPFLQRAPALHKADCHTMS